MANLTKCPHCGADIEDDSVFCDQCGTQLNKCSKCGKFIKGKFCPACGAPALAHNAPGAAVPPQPAPQQPQQPVQQPIQQPQQPQQPVQQPIQQPQQPQQPVQQPQQPQQPVQQPQQPQQPVYQQPYQQPGYQAPRPTTNPPVGGTSVAGAGGGPAPSRLSCRALGIILPLQPGAIIGRTNGNYLAQLGTLNFISGTHARLDFNGVNWSITDLGSTNGTMVNNVPCAPALPIKIGDVVRIARTYDFYVE